MDTLPEGVKVPSQFKKSIQGQRGFIEGFGDVLLGIASPNADDLKRHQGTTYAKAYELGRQSADEWKRNHSEAKP